MKNWTEMNTFQKAKFMMGAFAYIIGVALMYHAALLTICTWIVDHLDAIKRIGVSVRNLVRTCLSKPNGNEVTDN